MSSPSLPPRSSRPPVYRPRALLGLLYLLGIFLVISLLSILPEMMRILETTPPGPEQEELAKRVAEEAFRPRLYFTMTLAVLLTAGGGYLGVLPGLKLR